MAEGGGAGGQGRGKGARASEMLPPINNSRGMGAQALPNSHDRQTTKGEYLLNMKGMGALEDDVLCCSVYINTLLVGMKSDSEEAEC